MNAASTITVSKSGSLTLVSDGYSNANASTAFAHAFGLLTTGDTLSVQTGTYTANGTYILMQGKTNVNVIFEAGAILTITDNANTRVFLMQDCYNCTILNSTIDGNWLNQTASYPSQPADGIALFDCQYCIISNANITNVRGYGFSVVDESGIHRGNGIYNSTINNCGWNGITIGNGSDKTYDCTVSNCTITNCGDVGISSYAYHTIMINNYLDSMNGTLGDINSNCGVAIEGYGYSYIVGNRLFNNYSFSGYGIGLMSSGNNYVANNYVNGFKQSMNLGGDLLGNNVVVNNTLIDWGQGIGYPCGAQISTYGNIFAFNNITYTQNIGYSRAILTIDLYNNTLSNNTITFTVEDIYSTGIDMDGACSNYLLRWNTIKADTGVKISSGSSNNRLMQNNLTQCTSGIEDSGTNTVYLPLQESYINYAAYVQTKRVQATSTSASLTLDSTPGINNTLIATIAAEGADSTSVSSITQTGVTWTKAVSQLGFVNLIDTEIWYATVPSGSVSTEVNVTVSQSCDIVVNILEFANITLTDPLDTTGSTASNGALSTGTAGLTSQSNSVVVGCINVNGNYADNQTSATNGFTLIDGYFWTGKVGSAAVYKIVSAVGSYESATNNGDNPNYAYYAGAIATFKVSNTVINSSAPLATNVSTLQFNMPFLDGSSVPAVGYYYNYYLGDNQTITVTPDSGFNVTLNVDGENITESTISLSPSTEHIVYALLDGAAVGDTYTSAITVNSPANTTYSTSPTVNLSWLGNDTNNVLTYNVLFSNGSSTGNQTYTVPFVLTTVGDVSGTIYAYAVGDYASDAAQVSFSVVTSHPLVTPTVSISQPTGATYNTSRVLVSFTASGGTIDEKWYNVKNGTDWVYATNQSYTAPLFITGYVNGTYTFYAYANNTDGLIGSATSTFIVLIPASSPDITEPDIFIVQPFNRTYITGTVGVEINSVGAVDAIWYNLKNGSSWVYTYNLTYTTATSLTNLVNGTYTFYAFAANSETGYLEETVVFTVGIIPNPTLPQVNVDTLWLFLYEGNFLGFIQAYLVSTFLSLEAAVCIIVMLFMVPIYLKTKSLLLVSILWILLGSFFIVAMPAASSVALLFIALAVGGLLFKLFRPS